MISDWNYQFCYFLVSFPYMGKPGTVPKVGECSSGCGSRKRGHGPGSTTRAWPWKQWALEGESNSALVSSRSNSVRKSTSHHRHRDTVVCKTEQKDA